MERYSRVYETINLDAIRQNAEAMKANLKKETGMIGVVKADGYGHGSVPVARAIDSCVCGYATATLEEAVILRDHGIQKPVLILGVTPEGGYDEVIDYGIRPSIFRYDSAAHLSELAVRKGKTVSIHIALDTGMSRIGYPVTEAAADETARISRLPGIRIEGLFTHFARADEREKGATDLQTDLYRAFISMLSDRGITVPVLHCSNSAGILDLPQANFNAVRAGISIYGLYPSDEVGKESVRLIPSMEFKSSISYIKTIAPGTPVSYGGDFTAERETTVATIPVGYGDGYPRALSDKADVLICGRRARILGRVCMDQLMVDTTEIPEAEEGSGVTLIGRDGKEEITVEDLERICGGFRYELICNIGKRVPRIYMEGGKIVGVKDYFHDRYEGFGK